MGIAAARRFATKYHTNKSDIVALDGGDEVKTGCVDIACFDAVGAIKFAQQFIMVAKFAPVPVEAFGTEIFKILWKITPHCDGEAGHIAGGAALFAVW